MLKKSGKKGTKKKNKISTTPKKSQQVLNKAI